MDNRQSVRIPSCLHGFGELLSRPAIKKGLPIAVLIVLIMAYFIINAFLTNDLYLMYLTKYPGNVSEFLSRRTVNSYLEFTDEMYNENVVRSWTDTSSSTTNAKNQIRNLNNHDILWYNKPEWIHLDDFNNNLLKQCYYTNCIMSENRTNLYAYSSIIFTLSEGLSYSPPLLKSQRPKDQVWLLFYMESSANVYSYTKAMPSSWKSTINWTMSYRLDSDIKMPYGSIEKRTTTVNRNYEQIFSRKTKFAAWIVSHCGAKSGRDEFVYELRKHGVDVDVYGKCGTLGTKTGQEIDIIMQRDYKFYISFENTLCMDYVTEKYFKNYNHDLIIVARGANYSQLFPTGTYIDTAQFESIKSLAEYLIAVNSSKDLFTNYLKAKDKYIALNLYKMFRYGSCKLCDMLNNKNDNIKIYNDIRQYVHHPHYKCIPPKDVQIGFHHWTLLICISITFIVISLFACLQFDCVA